MSHLTQVFSEKGGQFILPEAELIERLKHIKAFVFDWDGVFTDAGKDHLMQSRFNEVDSMGTNLLRFSHYLLHKSLPITAIISGEKNNAAFVFADRERFHFSYSKFANKLDACKHLCEQNKIQPKEICFVFDDVLDLSLAEISGLRICVSRTSNPLFNEYILKHNLADYLTASTSGNFAVRETCELLIGLNGNYSDVVTHRKNYSEFYNSYLDLRKATKTFFFTSENGSVSEFKL